MTRGYCNETSVPPAHDPAPRDREQAIRLLAPAEVCTAYEHPNLAAWRSVQQASEGGGMVVMVFVADLDEKSDDPNVETLRDIVRG